MKRPLPGVLRVHINSPQTWAVLCDSFIPPLLPHYLTAGQRERLLFTPLCLKGDLKTMTTTKRVEASTKTWTDIQVKNF